MTHALRSFDHTAISKYEAYYAVRRALNELACALDHADYSGGRAEWVELVGDFAATTYFADCCESCGDRTEPYWPVAAEVRDGWILGIYACPAGHRWKCHWSIREWGTLSRPEPTVALRKRSKLPFRKVWDRDNWACRACGRHQDLTVDHIIPLARGGTDDLDNLQTLCRSCNSSKGAKLPA